MGHGISPAEVAGAQSGLNNFSQTLQQIINNKLQQQQLGVQNQQAQERIDNEEKERAQHAKEWEREAKRQDSQLDLQRQQADLNRQLLIQKATEGILKGQPLPGDQIGPATNSRLIPNPTGTGPNTEGTTFLHTLPFNGPDGKPMQVEINTPQEQARQEAEVTRIANAPAEEAKTREQQAAQEAEFGRQVRLNAQAHLDRLTEERQRDTYETTRQNNMIAAQKSLRSSEDAAAMQRTVINATGGLMGIPKQYGLGSGGVTITTDENGNPQITTKSPADFVTSVGNDIRDGNISEEQVRKLYPKQASLIFKYADDRGIKPLSQAQLDGLKGLNDVSKVGDTLKTLAQLRAAQGGRLDSLNLFNSANTNYPMLHDAGQLYKTKSQEFGQSTARVAGVLGNIRRLNAQDIQQVLGGLLPDQSASSDPFNGYDKYNKFITDIQNDFNTVTKGLPEGQKKLLIDKFGGNSLPYLSKTMNAPGQNPGTPGNAAPALPGSLPGLQPLVGPYQLPGGRIQ